VIPFRYLWVSKKLEMRTTDWTEHISGDPKVMYGKPVIKGTRIPVDLILEKLAMGSTTEQLLLAYPSITSESITACLLFAADSVKHETIHKAA
jgi:uncharacterized protein (DUF433 family)